MNFGVENLTINQTSQDMIMGYGGLVGFPNHSIIHNCYVAGVKIIAESNASNTRNYVGGLIGRIDSPNTSIDNCYASDVEISSSGSNFYCGGLVGSLEDGFVQNSYATVRTLSHVNTAGVLGGSIDPVEAVLLNSYYLPYETLTGFGNGQIDTKGVVESRTDTEFRSAAMVEALNARQCPASWMGTMGGYPTLHILYIVEEGEVRIFHDPRSGAQYLVKASGKATFQGAASLTLGDVAVRTDGASKIGQIDATVVIDRVRSLRLIQTIIPSSAMEIKWNGLALPFRPTRVTDQNERVMRSGVWNSKTFHPKLLVDGTYAAVTYDGANRAEYALNDPHGLKHWRFVDQFRTEEDRYADFYLVAVGADVTELRFYVEDAIWSKIPFDVRGTSQVLVPLEGKAPSGHWGWHIGGTTALYTSDVVLEQDNAQTPQYVQLFNGATQSYYAHSDLTQVPPFTLYFAQYVPEMVVQGAPAFLSVPPTARFAFELMSDDGLFLDRIYATIGQDAPSLNVPKMVQGNETRFAFASGESSYCALNATGDNVQFALNVTAHAVSNVRIGLTLADKNYRVTLNGVGLSEGDVVVPQATNTLRIERLSTKNEILTGGLKIVTVWRILYLSGMAVGEPIGVVNALGQFVVHIQAVGETQAICLPDAGLYVVNGRKVVVN